MKEIGLGIFVAANILMALQHHLMMQDGRKIKHGWWGLAYLAFAGVASLLTHSWILFVNSLFIRKVIFDTALNLFNHRPLFFVSTETTSIIDKLHYKLFKKKSEIYMTAYFIIIIILTILM